MANTPAWKKNNPNYKPINGAGLLKNKQGMENFDPNEYLEYDLEAPEGEKYADSTPFSTPSQTFTRKSNRKKKKK